METKLARIRLKPGSAKKVAELIEFMKAHRLLVFDEMSQKGYYWDSVFLDIQEDKEFLLVVIKSNDFSKIKSDQEIKPTAFRAYYELFKAEAWDQKSPDLIDSLWAPELQAFSRH